MELEGHRKVPGREGPNCVLACWGGPFSLPLTLMKDQRCPSAWTGPEPFPLTLAGAGFLLICGWFIWLRPAPP